MRQTRAAARAGTIHVDETASMDPASVPLPTTPLPERNPLVEVSANSSEPRPAQEPADDVDAKPNMTKSKGKSRKNKAAKKTAKDNRISLAVQPDTEASEQQPDVLEDDVSVVSSAASEEAAAELRKEYGGEISQVAIDDDEPTSPPSRAVRATRRQLAKNQGGPVEHGLNAGAEVANVAGTNEHNPAEAQLQSEGATSDYDQRPQSSYFVPPSQEAVTSAHTTPLEITVSRDSQGQLVISHAVTAANSTVVPNASSTAGHVDANASEPVLSSPKSTSGRVEDSIEALDALEEEIEKVQKDLPSMGVSLLPDMSKQQPMSTEKPKTSNRSSAVTNHTKERASLVSRRTSGEQKSASKARSDPNETVNRSEGINSNPKTTISRAGSQRTRNGPARAAANRERKPVEIPCSKPRPMNLNFPTPPPPPRSTKPPTTSTFALPGEAVAAKLKAAREERLKRLEEDTQKKPEPRARPVRRSVAPVIKPTATSIARQSLMQSIQEHKDMSEKNGGNPAMKTSTRASAVGPTTGGKRTSAAVSKRRPMAVQKSSVISEEKSEANKENLGTPSATPKRQTSLSSSAANTSKLRASPSGGLKSSTLKPRISSYTSNTSVLSSTSRTSRTSHVSSTTSRAGQVTKSEVRKADGTTQTAKGKEIFNRGKVEKEELERKRREKEEAAKKARAEAAERGRLASKAWAAKRGMKKAEAAAAGVTKDAEGVGKAVKQTA